MSYLPTWVLLFIGVVGSLALLVRLLLLRSRFRAVTSLVAGRFRDETGMLRARSAALRVGVAARRKPGRGSGRPAYAGRASTMTTRES